MPIIIKNKIETFNKENFQNKTDLVFGAIESLKKSTDDLNTCIINIEENIVMVVDNRNRSSVTAISKNGTRINDDKLRLFVNGERKTLSESARKKLIELLMEV